MAEIIEEIFVSKYLAASMATGVFIAGTGTNSTYVPWGLNNQILTVDATVASGVTWNYLYFGETNISTSFADAIMTGVTTGSFLQSQGTFWSPVSMVFGTMATNASADVASSTTVTAFTTKVTLTTLTFAPTQTHRIAWSCETTYGQTTSEAQVQVVLNGVTTLGSYALRPFNAATTEWTMLSGFNYQTNLSGTNTVTIQFASGTAGQTMQMRRARLESWRVS